MNDNLTELKDYDVENEIFKNISLTYNNYDYYKFDVYKKIVSSTGSVYSENFTFNNLNEVYDQISKTLLNNSSYKAASFYNDGSETTIYYHTSKNISYLKRGVVNRHKNFLLHITIIKNHIQFIFKN